MSVSASALDHVTPYDRAAWGDPQVEEWLASGAQRPVLTDYFGAAEYRSLAALARRARATALNSAAPRVLIVPGIMGSQLGLRRPSPLPSDILWLDPMDIQLGRLAALRLPPAAPIVPLGVVLFSYLRLKLHLRAAGFAVEFHDYDWRLPLAESGRALAEKLRNARPARLAVVAHSMGGLVSRVALALPATDHVDRVVLLGTPNSGSFAAVQAVRGTYSVVRKVARLATHSTAESLAAEIFSTFPSLYELLPTPPLSGRIDLLDEHAWPRSGPRPRGALLQAARALRGQLASADPRFAVIAGVGVATVTAVARRGDDFLYTVTRHGDGTVPAASAELSGARCAYAAGVAHSDLTRDPRVAAAVVDLLARSTTRRLPGRRASGSRACAQVSDRTLRHTQVAKVDWGKLTSTERRLFLQNLNEPPPLTLRR